MSRLFFPRARRAPRRGISMILFVLTLPVIIGVTGLVVDLTNLYTRRAVAQRAADAAALAGALVSDNDSTTSSGSNDPTIIAEARRYAKSNGYDADSGDAVAVDPHVNNVLGKVRVTLSRRESTFFLPILQALTGGNPIFSSQVGAHATAQKIVRSSLSLGGNYGTTTGASNPSAFGPYALHSFGDPYSVMYYDDGTPNTLENISHNKGNGWDQTSHYSEDGFTYNMSVSNAFAAANDTLRVQLYDPDDYDSKDGKSLDEVHNDYTPGHPPQKNAATTRYTIYKVRSDGSLQQIASQTYSDDQSVDAAYLKSQGQDPWVTPDGFRVPLGTYGAGEYKIRVKTLDGASENGYNLRAGPDYSGTLSETDWNTKYGDKGGVDPKSIQVPITADDHLQMNFTRSDHVRVRLAYLPASAAGKTMTVTKFDTDVGSTKINYSYVQDGSTSSITTPDNSYLNPNSDYWSQDKVTVPNDFKGGYWYAEYDAGQQDTSSWSIQYPGVGEGSVKLVE